MSLKNYITHSVSTGKYYFTREEVIKATGMTKVALHSSMGRLRKKGEIASPLKDFFIIIPPEYRSLGALPPEQFIDDLMRYLDLPYYVGLLSAAQFYGAAHQKPQSFQVIVPRPRRSISMGRVRIEFITKNTASLAATRKFNTARGFVSVATPETIATDLVSFSSQSGGISAVFDILSEIAENLTIEKFAKALKQLSKAPFLQRLGYFFELLELEDYAQLCHDELNKYSYVRRALLDPLDPTKGKHDKGVLNEKWNLIVNIDLEAENDT